MYVRLFCTCKVNGWSLTSDAVFSSDLSSASSSGSGEILGIIHVTDGVYRVIELKIALIRTQNIWSEDEEPERIRV